MPEPNGVQKTIAAAGTQRVVFEAFGVSQQALRQWINAGHFPLERAKEAHQRWGVPLRELVSPEVREAMDIEAQAQAQA